MRKMLVAALACLAPFAAHAAPAQGDPIVVMVVDRATQELHVSVNGVETYVWPVSTGRKLEWTRPGTYTVFTPQTEAYVHYHSHKVYCERNARTGHERCVHASMPYALFFDVGRAIHAATSNEYAKLGTRASHGCVRVRLEYAQTLFELVQKYGKEHAKVIVQ